MYAVLVLAIVMTVGTVGMMLLEAWGLIDSFYFMALIATAEGPAATPATAAGKIFAAVMGVPVYRRDDLSNHIHLRPTVQKRAQGGSAIC